MVAPPMSMRSRPACSATSRSPRSSRCSWSRRFSGSRFDVCCRCLASRSCSRPAHSSRSRSAPALLSAQCRRDWFLLDPIRLGDDFGLLLFEAYRHKRRGGAAHESAIAAAIRATLPGILLVTLTTVIGFLALTLSGSAGFAQLGAMVALGVAFCARSSRFFSSCSFATTRARSPPSGRPGFCTAPRAYCCRLSRC